MIAKLAMLASTTTFTVVGSDATERVNAAIVSPPPYTVTGPLVTVIIPTYNEEEYLSVLLTTINNQTYNNIEIIVVDDDSEDNTAAVAIEYGAKVVQKTDHVANLSVSRNMGATVASGEYLIFADADGAFEHVLVEKTVEEFANNKHLIYTNHCCIDDPIMNRIRVTLGTIDPVMVVPGSHIFTMVSVNGQYIAVTRQLYELAGGYNESMTPEGRYGEDRVFAMDCLKQCGIGKVGFLRNCYSSTSARRAQGVGMINDFFNRIKRYYGGTFNRMDREAAVR